MKLNPPFLITSKLYQENRFRTGAQAAPIALLTASFTTIELLTFIRINNIIFFDYFMQCFGHTAVTETPFCVQYNLFIPLPLLMNLRVGFFNFDN